MKKIILTLLFAAPAFLLLLCAEEHSVTILKDDFSKTNNLLWKSSSHVTKDGMVSSGQGNLWVTEKNNDYALLQFPKVVFKVKRTADECAFHIVTNVEKNGNYRFVLKNNLLNIAKQRSKNNFSKQVRFNFKKDQWYIFEISVNTKNQLSITVNGKVLLTVHDPKPLNKGTICFFTGKKPGVLFDEIEVLERFTGKKTKRVADFKDGKLPDWLFPHLSQWKVEKGYIRTVGKSPDAGWYLCTKHAGMVEKVSFKVKKTQKGGLVSLRSNSWQLLLRDDHLWIKNNLAHFADIWPLTIRKKIDFTPDVWHELSLQFNIRERSVNVSWDGKKLETWKSPLDGWKGIGYDDELSALRIPMGARDDILAFHSWQTPAMFTNIKIDGVETAVADYSPIFCLYTDDLNHNFKRLAPSKPVAAAPNKKAKDTDSDIRKTSWGKYVVSKAVKPFKQRVFIDKAGLYTLCMKITRIKNTNIALYVKINGKLVSSEAYHGLHSSGSCMPMYDYVPLKLERGIYDIEIGGGSKLRHYAAMGSITLDNISLQQGIKSPPAYVINTKNKQLPRAYTDNLTETEVFGKILNFDITGLAGGNYTLRLKSADMLLDKSGQRRMDVYINDCLVLKNWDIIKDAGRAMKISEKDFPVSVKDASKPIRLKIVGVNFHACLQGLEILRDNKVIYFNNIGWTSTLHTAPVLTAQNSKINSYGTFFDPEKNASSGIFQKNNSIGNPSFSKKEKNNIPVAWRSIGEMEKGLSLQLKIFGGKFPGIAKYSVDNQYFRSAPTALKISNVKGNFALTGTFCSIDHNKHQRISVWTKTEDADNVFLEVYWMKRDKIRDLCGFTPFKILSVSRSKVLNGTHDWTELVVDVKPPFDSLVAVPVLRVGEKSKNVFFDDAMLDVYGSDKLDILWSHAGYSADEFKEIFVRSTTQAPVTVELKDAATNKTVMKQNAVFVKKDDLTSRYYYKCDFSQFKKTGTYKFSAIQKGAVFTSDTFDIGSNVQHDIAAKIVKTLNINRISCEIPDYHALDWVEFALCRVNRDRFDANLKTDVSRPARNTIGGWYDASDSCRFNNQQTPALFALLRAAKKDNKNAAIVDELTWGVKGFLRITDEDGFSYQKIRGYEPEMLIPVKGSRAWLDWRKVLPHSSGLLAMVADLYKDKNRELATEALRKSETIYNNMTKTWKEHEQELLARSRVFKGLYQKPYNLVYLAPKALLPAIYLWKVTGNEKYKKDIYTYADMLMAGLKNKGYMELDYVPSQKSVCIYFDYILVPFLLLEEFPEYNKKDELKKELQNVFAEMKRLCKQNIYNVLPAMTPEKYGKSPDCPALTSHIGYLSNAAYCMKLGSNLFNDDELKKLSERQLQYIFGFNQFNLGMVGGIGKRFAQRATAMQFKPEYFYSYLKSGSKYIYGNFISAGTGWGSSVSPKDTMRYRHHRFGYVFGSNSGIPRLLTGPVSYATEGAGPEIYLPHYSNLMLALF